MDVRKSTFIITVVILAIALSAVYYISTSPDKNQLIEDEHRVKCAENLRQIGQAIKLYRDDFQAMPTDLQTLFNSKKVQNFEAFVCPSYDHSRCNHDGFYTDYYYWGTKFRDTADPKSFILAYDKPANHVTYVNVLFADGRVENYSTEEFRHLIKIQEQELNTNELQNK